MLTPSQLEKIPENIVDIYQQLEEFVITEISRRVAKAGKITETAEWQAIRAQEFGMSLETLEKKIAEILNLSQDQVEKLFEQSAVESIESDNILYEQAKLTPMHLDTAPELRGYLEAAITQTNGQLKNISQSLGFCIKGVNGKIKSKKLTQFYQETLDLAQFQVSSGVIDYNTAVKNAVKSMTRSGVRFIDYESGWSNRVDVAARRATLTGVNQMSQQMNMKTIEDIDTDIVEVTAHSGARPSHAKWQGKWYSLSGKSIKYPSLRKVTHYGEGDGLGDWYCRHQFYGVIPGASVPTYTEEQLKNIDPEPFGYKGKTYTHYEATQYQRKIETAMRETKREITGFKAAGLDEDFTNSSIKLQRQKQEYKEFSNVAGLRQKKERAQVLGYNKSISQKSVWANKKIENKANKMYNIGNTNDNVNSYLRDKPLRDKIKSDVIKKDLDIGQYKKHIPGNNDYKNYAAAYTNRGEYGPSILTISDKEAQDLINKYSGTGILGKDKNGNWNKTEVITVHDSNIGIVIDNRNNNQADTSVFKIKYGKKGAHIVPDYPSKKGVKSRK